MRRPMQMLSHALAIAALAACAAAPASEDPFEPDTAPTGEEMAVDIIVVRPLSLAGTVLGTAIFIVALPFNALTLNFYDPARRLILEPAKYTFVRPLGDLE
jgi:hypothetical protein